MSVMHMFELTFCVLFMRSDRLSESRSWLSPSPEDGRKMSKEVRHGLLHVLTLGGLCQRTCGVVLKRRVEKRNSSSRGTGVERMTKACGLGNAPMVMSSGRGNECGAR